MSGQRSPRRKRQMVRLARAYVRRVRAKARCVKCGRRPIDFHRTEHVDKPYNRIPNLVAVGMSIARIAREIKASTPLCRRCHQVHDGRLERFVQAGAPYRNRPGDPKPCAECGRPWKPLRRGRCKRCADRFYRKHEKA